MNGLDFKSLARRIRKQRMTSLKESVQDLDARLKGILSEVEEIYRSVGSASDLSEFEKERLTKKFGKEIIVLTSEWAGQIQSFPSSFSQNNKKLLRKD
jgi:hypothetical protein